MIDVDHDKDQEALNRWRKTAYEWEQAKLWATLVVVMAIGITFWVAIGWLVGWFS